MSKRPEHRDVMIWKTIRAACEHIRLAEFALGLDPQHPGYLDREAGALQLMDARGVLGELANALADEAANA